MTEMLKPESGESIYDPTCGSAGMLISAIAYLKEQGKEWRNVAVYGQEINALTSAIGRMNLFLHGVKDFTIVNDDTLKNPAFIQNGQLQTFDLVLANPPYSISQWDRAAFESDKYGRNFLGVPPQGRADYAFIQHILKSMNNKTGRCAILLPHGILNRQDEKAIRRNMILADFVECVIGVGKNLFYNSPMEACILICRTNKAFSRKGKVLFIDGRRYVTRQGTDSFLTNEQIMSIANIYSCFKAEENLSAVKTIAELEENDFSLAINKYVQHTGGTDECEDTELEELISTWLYRSGVMHEALLPIIESIKGNKNGNS